MAKVYFLANKGSAYFYCVADIGEVDYAPFPIGEATDADGAVFINKFTSITNWVFSDFARAWRVVSEFDAYKKGNDANTFISMMRSLYVEMPIPQDDDCKDLLMVAFPDTQECIRTSRSVAEETFQEMVSMLHNSFGKPNGCA